MIIKTVKFKRTQDSNWEAGLSIESDGDTNNIIIDQDDNILEKDNRGICCYDCKDVNGLQIDTRGILKIMLL